MRRKVVIKLSMSGQKSRSKAIKTVVSGVSGIDSVAFIGQDKDHLEVIGYGIDPIALVKLLRKTIGFAELVSVAPVGEAREKKDDKKTGERKMRRLSQLIFSHYTTLDQTFSIYVM